MDLNRLTENDMDYTSIYDRNLRNNIANCLNEHFGYAYAKDDGEAATSVINRLELDYEYSDVLDFLYASDCDDSIRYTICKKIYDLIKDVDFGRKCFRYTAYAHNDYEEFKAFLLECYSHRRNMIWR